MAKTLTPKTEELYLERIRAMTGEERMKRAFALCRLVWKIAADSIRNDDPAIPEQKLQEKLKLRLRQ